ncbi:MAG: DUF5615 family PIN-like protein [Planctomycetota bacterium]|jgi:predicted nuclease of predicted toxin-antitoxin system|nr:DUF5615 family PIN-like protein [Planctomycetota bacterium]
MPREIQFHLDENVNPAIADGLKRRSIDVTTTSDGGLLGALDEEHVNFALANNRVIFTHDDDYLKLHQQGVQHAGIVYGHQEKHTIGEIIRSLVLICECLNAEEMKNTVEFL